MNPEKTLVLSVVICLLTFWFYTSSTSPFISGDFASVYNDAHFIASVGRNLIFGHGVSYSGDGQSFTLLDPEISSGPVIFLPVAIWLGAGMDPVVVFQLSAMSLNIILLAMLLVVHAKELDTFPFFYFASAVAALALAYQPWQWFLCLGETSAVLFLLMSAYSVVYCHECGWKMAVLSGVAFSFAIFSKMLALLVAPVFVFYLAGNGRLMFAWISGFLAIVAVYALFVWCSSPDSIKTVFWPAIYRYFSFNLGFGFPSFFDSENSESYEALAMVRHNFSTMSGQVASESTLMSSAVLLLFITGFCFLWSIRSAVAKPRIRLIFSMVAILGVWYFFAGFHYDRYFYVSGWLGLWACIYLAANLLQYRGGYIFPVLCLGLIAVFVWHLQTYRYAGVRYHFLEDTSEVASLIGRGSRPAVAGLSMSAPYNDLAYYAVKDDSYVHLLRFAESESVIVLPQDCVGNSGGGPSFAACNAMHPGAAWRLQWKENFSPVNYIEKKGEEFFSAQGLCEFHLFENNNYRVLGCSQAAMTKIIESVSNGRISFVGVRPG